jgi:hypothetical protein
MNLIDQLADYVNAAFSGLWVQTSEPDEAEREIAQAARQRNWKVAAWDIAQGLRFPNAAHQAATDVGTGDPLAVLRALPTLADRDGTALLLLHQFHRYLNNAEVVQTAFSQLVAGKQQRTFLVVLSPVVQIPVELEKLFVVLEHALPDRAQLERIARELTSDSPEDLPRGEDLQRALDAATGLTRYECEGAFALSLTRHNALRPDAVWELKAQALKKNNLLTLHRGGERFDDLGGLANLKDFCRRALRPGHTVQPLGRLRHVPEQLGPGDSRLPLPLGPVEAVAEGLVGEFEGDGEAARQVPEIDDRKQAVVANPAEQLQGTQLRLNPTGLTPHSLEGRGPVRPGHSPHFSIRPPAQTVLKLVPWHRAGAGVPHEQGGAVRRPVPRRT